MMRRFGALIVVLASALLCVTPAMARPARGDYGLPNACGIDPYRLAVSHYGDWWHVAGDAAQKCGGGVVQQGLFVELYERWLKPKPHWVFEGGGDVSKGGANQTIFAGDEVGCGSTEKREWSMHARGFYQDIHALWWFQTRYRTTYLFCRN